MTEQISLFDLTTSPFELYLRKHHVFLTSSSSENQKAADFQKRRFSEKRMDYHPGKVSLFGGHEFSPNHISVFV
jgi:hypothetical protein